MKYYSEAVRPQSPSVFQEHGNKVGSASPYVSWYISCSIRGRSRSTLKLKTSNNGQWLLSDHRCFLLLQMQGSTSEGV